jgi:hypothetical protein
MKKIFIIIIFNILFLNNSFSKIIDLTCPTQKGGPWTFNIDTDKKMVGKYEYKLNPNNEIEFNFAVPSQKDANKFAVFFVKINLEKDTYIFKVLDEVKKNQLRVIMRKIDNDQFYFDDIKQGIVQQELRPVKCQNLKGKSEVQKTTDNKRIEDYELEFYKIGDSLLDIADVSLILEAKKISNFQNRKYFDVTFEIDSALYDHATFYIRSGDLNYEILAIALGKEMNLGQCLENKKEITIKWKEKFSEQYFITGKKPIEIDQTGKSITYTEQFTFYDNAVARVSCRDWSKKIKKDWGYGNDLRVSYESGEITKWMVNGYN